MNLTQRMFAATAVTVFGFVLYACGGGTSVADDTLTPAQFDTLLKASPLYASLNTSITALQTHQVADEKTLARVSLFGHAPANNTAASATLSANIRTDAMDISFGPCTDMGVHVGDSAPDPAEAITEFFKQCTDYKYGAVVETGAIATPFVLWFDGSNCSGNMIEFENDGSYNRQVLQEGIVFRSPVDGSTNMVKSGQPAQTMTARSNYSSGSCNVATETNTGYVVTPNDVSVTGVPSMVPSNFVF